MAAEDRRNRNEQIKQSLAAMSKPATVGG
jgi:hypothetical protein